MEENAGIWVSILLLLCKPTAKLQFKDFSLPFPLKKGAFMVEDSLVGRDTNQETSEMEAISMASPDKAAVKKSKRMTLSCPFQ